MVIGFDTYHDGARRGESIGALIASLNGSLTRYYSRVTYHKNKDEMSSSVASLFRGKSSFVFNLKLISFCSFLSPLFLNVRSTQTVSRSEWNASRNHHLLPGRSW